MSHSVREEEMATAEQAQGTEQTTDEVVNTVVDGETSVAPTRYFTVPGIDPFDAIPDDLRDYADAEEVITRALQAALRGDLAPGGADPTPGDDPSIPGSGDNSDGSGGAGNGDNPQAAPDVDTSGPSSIPIPLLVLGGMSLALLAAGGLGYLSRRRAAAGDTQPPDELTP